MRRYRQAKEHLQADVQARLERDAVAEDGAEITPRHRESMRHDAAGIVDEFERLAENRGYKRAVMQSFWGSWLYTLSVLALSVLAYAASLNFRSMVTNVFEALRHPGQEQNVAPRVAPTPSPSATPRSNDPADSVKGHTDP